MVERGCERARWANMSAHVRPGHSHAPVKVRFVGVRGVEDEIKLSK